jgi:hypothetical protein
VPRASASSASSESSFASAVSAWPASFSEVGAERVRRVQRMACRAARLAHEQRVAANRLLRHRLLVAGEPAIERRVEEHECALERRDRLLDRRVVDRPPERRLERGGVLRDLRELRDRRLAVGHAHLDRVHHGLPRLVRERRRAAVPEQRLDQRRVHRRRSVAAAELAADALADRAQVRERTAHVVARRTRHRVVGRQPRVEVERATERDHLGAVGLRREQPPERRVDAGRHTAAGVRLQLVEQRFLRAERERTVRGAFLGEEMAGRQVAGRQCQRESEARAGTERTHAFLRERDVRPAVRALARLPVEDEEGDEDSDVAEHARQRPCSSTV